MKGWVVIMPEGPKPMVAPSALACATAAAAIVPPAPSRFSTTTFKLPPMACRNGSAKARAMMSMTVPLEKGITRVTLRPGISWAPAEDNAGVASRLARRVRRCIGYPQWVARAVVNHGQSAT